MIKFESVSKKYTRKSQTIEALSDVSFEIKPHAITGIIGKSGAGKSSILRLINGLDKPDTGRIIVNGTDITQSADKRPIRKSIGFVFQHLNLVHNCTVFDNIAVPLRLKGLEPSAIKKRISELLELVELDARHEHYPGELSGGQKQRVAIARALAAEPAILLFDEATSALDPETTGKIIELIIQLQKALNLTIVFVSHEIDFVKKLADEIILLDKGKIVEKCEKVRFFVTPTTQLGKEYVFSDLNKHIPFQYTIEPKSPESNILLRLSFNTDKVFEPTMAKLSQTHGILFNIIAGEVEQIDDRQVGHLAIMIANQDKETSVQYFMENEIRHEILGYV